MTPLLLPARQLQRPLNRGHRFGRVSDGDGLQGEPIGPKAGEQVRSRLSLQLHGRDEAGRHPRLPLRLRQEHEVVTLAQLDLERQDLENDEGRFCYVTPELRAMLAVRSSACGR
jgi:hypothetical protein